MTDIINVEGQKHILTTGEQFEKYLSDYHIKKFVGIGINTDNELVSIGVNFTPEDSVDALMFLFRILERGGFKTTKDSLIKIPNFEVKEFDLNDING